MILEDIKVNAETIWQLLNRKGAMSIHEIVESTSYDMVMIPLALGWLARENKIRFTAYNGVIYVELVPISNDVYY